MSTAFAPTHRLTIATPGHSRTILVRCEDDRGQVCEPVDGARLTEESDEYGMGEWRVTDAGPRHVAHDSRWTVTLDAIESAPVYVRCDVCSGSGHLAHFAHVDGGICYECDGSGECERRESSGPIRAPRALHNPLEYLRDLYRAARSQTREDGLTPYQWARDEGGFCGAATVLVLLSEISAEDRARALPAWAALGLPLDTLQEIAAEGRTR